MSSACEQSETRSGWDSVRDRVLKRDGYACRFCGMSNEEHKEKHNNQGLHAHHVLPRADGGEDHPDNLITVCNSCHQTVESAHANAVDHAVSDSGVTTDHGRNAWEWREHWLESADRLIVKADKWLDRHPTIQRTQKTYVGNDGDFSVLGEPQHALLKNASVNITSEHYLYYVLGQAEAYIQCACTLEEIFDVDYMKKCKREEANDDA